MLAKSFAFVRAQTVCCNRRLDCNTFRFYLFQVTADPSNVTPHSPDVIYIRLRGKIRLNSDFFTFAP